MLRKPMNQEEYEEILNISDLQTHPKLKGIAFDGWPIVNTEFSVDHQHIALILEIHGKQVLVIRNLKEGKFTNIYRENVDDGCVFDEADNIYYVEKDPVSLKGRYVYSEHVSGPDSSEVLEDSAISMSVDSRKLIFSEEDLQYNLELSQSSHYVFIRAFNELSDHALQATEFWFRALNNSDKEFLRVQERKEGVFYNVKEHESEFYILIYTPEEPNGQIVKSLIPPYYRYNRPEEEIELPDSSEVQTKFMGAVPFVPHSPDLSIEHLETFQDYILQVLIDNSTSLQYIQVQNLKTGSTDMVTYDDYEGQLKIANNKSYRIHLEPQEFQSQNFKYRLSTLHSPEQLINYRLDSRTNEVIDFAEHIPEVNLTNYTSERIVLPGNDGEMLPVTLIYHKHFVKSSGNFVVLHTLGTNSHEFTMDYLWLSMLDRGIMWAIPHIRGTPDLNHNWMMAGCGKLKPRHFQDFLDVTVSLVSEKIAKEVCAYGDGHSGGLTVASVLAREPDIYSACVLRNPILDVKKFVGSNRALAEFGAVYDEEATQIINNYSPYQQEWGETCPLLIGADYDDPCVFDSIKFIAKMRQHERKQPSVLYKEYPTWTTEPIKRAEEYSFILSETIHKKSNKNKP